MEKTDTGLAQLDNCTKHALIHSPPKSLTSQKACNIECHVHTCHSHPATDNDTIFTAMIIFQDVLKQKVLLQSALWLWSDKGGYQLTEEIRILQPENLTTWACWFFYGKYHNLLPAGIFTRKRNEKYFSWDKNCWLYCCEFCCERSCN